MNGARRFIVVSSPRCGTHMLRTALDSHPNIVCRAESFNPDLVDPEPYDTSWTTRDILDTHIFKQRLPKIHTVGFAVHRGDAPLGPWIDIWDQLLDDPELSVILLHRHDLLRRFLSFQLMRERNRSGDPGFEPSPRRLDTDALRAEFLRYEAELADFRRRFADHRRFQVSYEELRDQFPRAALRLQRFLGVPSHPIAPKTQQNPQRRLEDLVTNLAELRDAFRSSRWAWCFQPGDQRRPTTEARAATDRAVEGKAQLVRAPATLVRRRAAGQRPRRDILKTEAAFYSPNREELVVRDYFQDRRGCIFVDVGAGHPVHFNRTFFLEQQLGWFGLAIGVEARHVPIYETLRPRTRLCPTAPWTGTDTPDDGEVAPRAVALDDLLVDQGVERIDWLTLGPDIDTPTVLAGLDLRRRRPNLLHIAAQEDQPPSAIWRRSVLDTVRRADYALVEQYANEAGLYLRPR